MRKWEQVLGEELPLNSWQLIWSQASKSSICTLYKENQYKILYHWYQTPDLLHSIYPSADCRCWRCNTAVGTLYHIFWTCPLITPYWRLVNSLIHSIFGSWVPFNPTIFLLGLPPPSFSKTARKLHAHAARCLIALRDPKRDPPSMADLHSRIRDVKRMESLTASINDTLKAHNRVWEMWDSLESPSAWSLPNLVTSCVDNDSGLRGGSWCGWLLFTTFSSPFLLSLPLLGSLDSFLFVCYVFFICQYAHSSALSY